MKRPHLVGAKECSIFWKNGAWRDNWQHGAPGSPDAFYRRATYAEKINLVGRDPYSPGEGLTGWVIKHGSTLRIDDITDESALERIAPDLKWSDKAGGYRNSPDKDHQRAFIAVPVKIDKEVMGVIRIAKTIEPFPVGKFTEEHQRLLELFAQHVAAIINRVEAAALKDFWEDLYLSGISLNRDDFPQYLQCVADEVPKYLGARGCSIFLTETNGKSLLRLAATTTDGPLMESIGTATYEFGEGLTGWVGLHKKPLRLKDVDDVAELRQHGQDVVHKGKHEEYLKDNSSYLAAPIVLNEQVLGVIRIAQDAAGKVFSSSDQRSLEYFCRNLAVLVQNVSLFEKVQREKEDALKRLRLNQQKLRSLGRDLKEDLIGIQRSLRELLPDDEDEPFKRLGPFVLSNKPRDPKSVFIGVPFAPSYRNVLEYAIFPALRDLGLVPWVASEQRTALEIIRKVLEGIYASNIGIVDISDWNANVLFELGVLYGQNRSVILLKREDAPKPPTDLAGLEFIQYGEFGPLKDALLESLQSVLEGQSAYSGRCRSAFRGDGDRDSKRMPITIPR